VLKVDQLDVSIGAVQILRGIGFELPAGSMTGLIGRNGAGKTTLIKSIVGLLSPGRGSIVYDGTNLAGVPPHGRNALGIGYMPEDRRLIPELTIEENLLVPLWAVRAPDAAERLEAVYRMIPELREFAPRKGLQLSGGQQKLAALGRALMYGRKLLLLDEPFEGVAPALAQRLVQVISGLKNQGLTVLLSESDLQHSESMIDGLLSIDRGSLTRTR
jgi:branched-chain amino acid transport system ATP-binding protein